MTRGSMTAAPTFIELPDRRTLTFAVYGMPLEEGGWPVIALHGTPGSRLMYAPAHEDAARRGLAIIAVDRWGYGGTDAVPAPALSAFARDVSHVADHLALNRFSVVGISGGGPFAAAVAAQLGDRIERVALGAPVGPIAAGAVPGESRISLFHRFCFTVLPLAPFAVRAVFRLYRRIVNRRPRLAIRIAMARSGAADLALLDRPGVVADLAAMMREGLRPGLTGPAIDLALFSRPWDVDLSSVTAPTRIWFGDQDGSVPRRGIDRLAGAIPGTRVSHLAAQGHFWIATRFPDVLDWLCEPRNGVGDEAQTAGRHAK